MSKLETQVVVIDDERYICGIIDESLASEKYTVITFTDPPAAFDYIENNRVDLVLTDLVMGEYSGVQVLDKTLQFHEDAAVIMMTAHPTVQTAIAVLKKGAYDFLVKPFKLEVLKATIKRALTHQKLIRENLRLKSQVEFLKVANSYGVDQSLDDYLTLVLNSSRTEFSAAASAMIVLNTETGEVDRALFSVDDESERQQLLDEAYIDRLAYSRSSKPNIKVNEIQCGDKTQTVTTITQPVFIRRKMAGVIALRIIDRFSNVTPGKLDVLSILANSASSALANQKLYDDLQQSYLEVINSLAHAIEARDQCTSGHNDRVVKLARLVAVELGWVEKDLDHLSMGCTLHDIGKLGVPDSVLNKPGNLTDEERRIMQQHPELGLKIVGGIALLKPAIPYIIAHHERYDGQGYPHGLAGEAIPIEGRLLSVVDTFDAILSDRPYRVGGSLEKALRELWENRGTQFDPAIVETFIRMIQSGKIDFNDLYDREEYVAVAQKFSPLEKVLV